jgi:spermidine synthase
VRTFARHFKSTMVWQTHYDAEVIGSNAPLVLDEERLQRRLSDPGVRASLESVALGTAEDFLAHFLMGPRGVAAYGAGGFVNTDDNLFLEFSTPRSMGVGRLSGDNVEVLARYREDIRPYLSPAVDPATSAARDETWTRNQRAAKPYDRAHALILRGETGGEAFARLMAELGRDHPDYAPFRFLAAEQRREIARDPLLVRSLPLAVLPAAGAWRTLTLSAVTMRLQPGRAVVVFVDPDAKEILGQVMIDAPAEELDALVPRTANDVLDAIEAAYRRLAGAATASGRSAPAEREVLDEIRAVVRAKGGF